MHQVFCATFSASDKMTQTREAGFEKCQMIVGQCKSGPHDGDWVLRRRGKLVVAVAFVEAN